MASWNKGKSAVLDFLRSYIGYTGDDCVLWPYSHNGTGYGHFHTSKIRGYAHRLMCEWTHGPAPSPEHEAAHSCGKRPCINPNHLSWKTPSGNQMDSVEQGTHYSKPGRLRFKLTEEQVSEIKALCLSGHTPNDLEDQDRDNMENG